MERLISFVGLMLMVFIAYLLSTSKKDINWRTVISGIIIQLIFGLLIL
ncbi:MAG: NupC/NupG family nucleoside CNT transporter, partial [Bdellovibrionales bacterium]|nr:NupC/NupG family nucleoside CNT transporter [Bdellovibrionales bacterium]